MMNSLFPLPLIGVGTADVESLPSYLIRLAATHRRSVGQLFSFLEEAFSAEKNGLGHPVRSLRNLSVGSFSRPNQTTERLVGALSIATGQDNFRCGTYLALMHPFTHMPNQFCESFRWCRACMTEWESKGEAGYFKLLWQWKEVEYCQIHFVPLSETCEGCGSKQDTMSRSASATRCNSCNASLGSKLRPSDVLPYRKRLSGDVIQLVECIASDPNIAFRRDSIRQIMEILDLEAELSQGTANLFNALCPLFGKFLHTDRRVTVSELRVFCAVAGISLVDALVGRYQGQSAPLDGSWTLPLLDARAKVTRTRHNLQTRKVALLDHLKTVRASAPSLASVARAVNVSTGFLCYRFPRIVKQISMARDKALREKRWNDECKASKEAIQYFLNPSVESAHKSRKQAIAVIRQSTGLGKHLVRKQVLSAYSAIMSSEDLRKHVRPEPAPSGDSLPTRMRCRRAEELTCKDQS